MILSWHSFDLKTGRRGAPVIVRDETFPILERVIGEVTNATVDVLCWDEEQQAPVPGWEAATLPGRTMLVALDEYDIPIWGGKVDRTRSNQSAWVSCDLSTLESYLDRRFVKDHTYTGTAQDQIISEVMTQDVLPDGVQFVLDLNSSILRDRTFADQDDRTMLALLEDFAADSGGMDWTIDLAWTDDTHTALQRILRVRTTLGQQSNATFSQPGSVTTVTYIVDFTSDFGANDVLAFSAGNGQSLRPESAHHVAQDHLDAGWCRFERRDQPNISLLDVEALDSYAAADLARMQDGAVQLSIESTLDNAPRFGSDFHLGDSVLVQLTCPRFPEQTGPDGDRVAGFSSWQRVVGVTVDVKGNRLVPRFLGGAQ